MMVALDLDDDSKACVHAVGDAEQAPQRIADLDVEFELGQACGRGIQPVFGLETRCAPDADAGERRFEPRSVPSSGLPQGALEQLRAGELKVRLSRAAV